MPSRFDNIAPRMSATERLYYHDSHLLEFDARVMDLTERDDGQMAVRLDRTAFYPTGGGQPHDTGTLGSAQVVDCIDMEAAGVLHIVQGPPPKAGEMVHGRIDSRRRLDHMQQHTGQHILSAALVKLFEAPTRSFRMLEHECEIDVALDDSTSEGIERAVDLANQTIWQNRLITIHNVSAQEASALPLRKEPAREGQLRVIEIDGFDMTPCGGTHARSTGEVGIIAVRSWERAKGLARIQFMAGVRVLNDYRKANRTAAEVATAFSAARDDSPALMTRLIEENKKLARRVRELDQIACRIEAEDILESSGLLAANNRHPLVVARVFEDRDADALKRLALALIAHPNVIALLGSRDGEAARLVFARSPDARADMNALMRKACEAVEGRGGGKPDMAQGGGRKVTGIDEALQVARNLLTQA
ncbi:MAG: DHHA1 domain-containing protein [Pyrinomonadaceae bacterium]